MNVLTWILVIVGVYLAVGAAFAGAFVTVIVGRVDPGARHGPWSFRALIFPGAMALWPLLLLKWTRRKSPPAPADPRLRRIEKTRSALIGAGAYWGLVLLAWFAIVAASRWGGSP